MPDRPPRPPRVEPRPRLERTARAGAHAHTRGHDEPSGVALARLRAALGAIAVVLVAEVVVGLRSGSLALLGDGVHLATDAGSLLLVWMATLHAGRAPTARRTFGFHRSTTLAATANGTALLVLAAAIAVAAAMRLGDPPALDALPVLLTALVALATGCAVTAILAGAGGEIGVRSALLHAAGDALASAGVVAAAAITLTTGWRRADAVVSLGIAALIAAGAIRLLREALHILGEGTPDGVDAEGVRAAILAGEGVVDVHDLHIWALDRRHRFLSAHVEVADAPLSAVTASLQRLETELCGTFGIEHVTLQPECPACVGADEVFCDVDRRHAGHGAAVTRSAPRG